MPILRRGSSGPSAWAPDIQGRASETCRPDNLPTMLQISRPQMSRLSVAKRDHFAARVDALLVRQVGSTWSVRPVSERLRRPLDACSRGLALGIEQEVYLAQFALLHLMAGEPFLNRSDAQGIIVDIEMTWREKMFQLIALAGIDLSDGVRRDA